MLNLPKLAAPARRALANAGITSLTDLSERTEQELLALHGVGPNAVHTLREALKTHQLAFKGDQDDPSKSAV